MPPTVLALLGPDTVYVVVLEWMSPADINVMVLVLDVAEVINPDAVEFDVSRLLIKYKQGM